MLKRYTQISVFTDNRPGTLARISRALARQGVQILAVAAWGEVDHGVVRMVVDRPREALHLLEEHSMMATETPVLGVHLPHEPGILHRVASALARRKVNVDYCYGSDHPEGGGFLFLKVSSLKEAEAALRASFGARTRRTTKRKG